MEVRESAVPPAEAIARNTPLAKVRSQLAQIPLLGWLFGALLAMVIEQVVGYLLALALGLRGIPGLFGLRIMLDKPALIPSAAAYVLLVYVVPTLAVARLSAPRAHRLAKQLLDRFPLWV